MNSLSASACVEAVTLEVNELSNLAWSFAELYFADGDLMASMAFRGEAKLHQLGA